MIGALTLDQMRILVAAADHGSFSAAGRALGRAQSAISHQIQTLEALLELDLFDRAGRLPVATEAGRVLIEQSRAVLREAERMAAMAESMRGGVEPELSLSIDSLVPLPPVIAALRGLAAEFPDLAVRLHTDGIGAPERRLRNREVQIAVCSPFGAPGDLVRRPIASVRMEPVVAPSHALAQGLVTRARLEDALQLILTDPAAAPSAPSHGVIARRVWRFSDLASRLQFLLAGFGWGNVPTHLAAEHLAAGRLVRLEPVDMSPAAGTIAMDAVHISDRPPGRAGRWFLDALARGVRG